MRRRAISLVGVLGVALSLAGEALPLFDGFISPPKETYPSMWVFKLGVDSPREVITYDLEEFTKVGISEFMIIGNGAAITAAKPYGEPALKGKMHGARADRLRWALHEANRLGLGVWIMLGPGGCGNNNCPPELAQKYLMLTTARATAGTDGMVRVTLPKKGAEESPRISTAPPARSRGRRRCPARGSSSAPAPCRRCSALLAASSTT